jgi:pyruvate dehydrogenase E2 component (dihydrolipoamide acetyltransferase)
MSKVFELPELGENIQSATVSSLLVSPGDTIESGDNVLELETDKAVVELPCPWGGKILEVHVAPNDELTVGTPILTVESTGPAPDAKPEEEDAPEEEPPPSPPAQEAEPVPQAAPTPPPEPIEPRRRYRVPAPAGPATRRLAREMGVDLYQVQGTGPGGRIQKEDVKRYVKELTTATQAGGIGPGFAAPPLPDFSQWGEIERKPMSGVRKATARAMHVAWSQIPHVTQFDKADITELEAGRKRYKQQLGERAKHVTITSLVLKALTAALKEFPQANASIDMATEEVIYKKYYHIGVAVDTEHGLLVPVIRDVDKKNVLQISDELSVLAAKARDRKLASADMQGGTFTVTNLGGIAGTGFTPIVYHPQVAILGVSKSSLEQVIIDGEPKVRLMMPLSLSYDHRIVDGADGARFLKKITQLLADPVLLAMEN